MENNKIKMEDDVPTVNCYCGWLVANCPARALDLDLVWCKECKEWMCVLQYYGGMARYYQRWEHDDIACHICEEKKTNQ